MTAKKILLVSTYPIKDPKHGGQKRTSAIYEAYKENFTDVRHSAVFYGDFYDTYDDDDILLSSESELKVQASPLTGDIICGQAIFEDAAVKKRMKHLLLSFLPDIIHIEQPFPYIGLRPLLTELGLNPKIIFGSQNIEAPMKREILVSYGATEPQIEDAVAFIAELESQLSAACDLLVACTEADLAEHMKMGAKNVVLARNGIADARTDGASMRYWRKILEENNIKHTALFVGSAHPPNWVGFLEMVGKGLGFLDYDSRLIIAGSITDYFEREISAEAQNIEDATFWLRALSAGRLSEESLGSLLMLSEIILLPITEGGGSNLKTAEAILADKKVVATKHALRSFEWFKDFPNVWVAESDVQFRAAIVEAIRTKRRTRSKSQQQLANTVRWENCLKELLEKVDEL